MDPITTQPPNATGGTGSIDQTAADFQAAYDQVVSSMAVGALSIVLEEMIQTASAEE